MQLYLPGSGAALELYRLGRELGKLEVVVLSKFCEEGDNRKDTLHYGRRGCSRHSQL